MKLKAELNLSLICDGEKDLKYSMSDLTSDGYEVQLIRVRDRASVVGALVSLTRKHLDDFSIVWRERLKTSADEDQYGNCKKINSQQLTWGNSNIPLS